MDWTKIYKKYKGQWIALASDEITVIANGDTAKEALGKANERGYSNPILNRVPSEFITFAGAHEISL
ncbi:MAG: DUF5678 domain-containing protein [Candidatus Paceibacterota bacterium]|jgi:hypothetical protein